MGFQLVSDLIIYPCFRALRVSTFEHENAPHGNLKMTENMYFYGLISYFAFVVQCAHAEPYLLPQTWS